MEYFGLNRCSNPINRTRYLVITIFRERKKHLVYKQVILLQVFYFMELRTIRLILEYLYLRMFVGD